MFLIVEVSWAHIFTRYYFAPNAEMTADSLGHYRYLYYAGDDAYTAPAVKVMDWEARTNSVYQITRGNLGSVLQYEDEEGTHYFQFSYSPWGVRTHIGDETNFYQPGVKFFGNSYCPIYRTYIGHEDLWMFGLINANARLYSPYLGRFVSPDPLLNSEGGALDYNPYIYARNNPYKYIDRNGEFPWLIGAAVAAFVTAGGVANVVRNWSDIHSVWEGAGYFFLGAGVAGATAAGAVVLGTAAAYAAPYIAGVLGVAAESAVALGTAYAAAGAVYYVYEGCLNSAVYGTPFEFSWNGLAMTMATWAIPAGVEGYMLARAKGLNGWTGLEKSNVMATRHRPVMTEFDEIADLPTKERPLSTQPDPAEVLEQAHVQTGQGNSSVYVGRDAENKIRYVGRTDRKPEIRFQEHFHDGSKKSIIVKFEPIKTTLDHNSSRAAEQILINKYGMKKNGGDLINKVNSISPKQWKKFGVE